MASSMEAMAAPITVWQAWTRRGRCQIGWRRWGWRASSRVPVLAAISRLADHAVYARKYATHAQASAGRGTTCGIAADMAIPAIGAWEATSMFVPEDSANM